MDSLVAALVFVVLALAAWWWLRGRSGFAVDPSATYVLSASGGFLRIHDRWHQGIAKASGTQFRLVPAPGALAGALDVTGDAYTMVRATGDLAGLTLGCLVDDGGFYLEWGAPTPAYLEVRSDAVVIRGSGSYSALISHDDGFSALYMISTLDRPITYSNGPELVNALDGRNLALVVPVHGFGPTTRMEPFQHFDPRFTPFFQLAPA